MKKKILIVDFIILGVLIVLSILVLINRSIKLKHHVSDNLVLSKKYDIIFDEINIDSEASDIEIKEGFDSNIKLVVYGDEERTKIEENDNKLFITTTQKKCNFFCFNQKISKIEIYLPKDYSKNINISNAFGDVNIDDFSKLTLDVKANAGDVIIGEINSLKAKLDYGDIKINKINEYLDIKNACGDVNIDSINLEMNSIIKSNLGDIKIGSTNKIYIEAKTSLGDVEIKNNYKDSNIRLKIDNDCGDIKVNN